MGDTYKTKSAILFGRTRTMDCSSYIVFIHLFVYLSMGLFVCLSAHLSVYLSVSLFGYLAIRLSIYSSVCLSACLSVCLSICSFSVCIHACASVDSNAYLLRRCPCRTIAGGPIQWTEQPWPKTRRACTAAGSLLRYSAPSLLTGFLYHYFVAYRQHFF